MSGEGEVYSEQEDEGQRDEAGFTQTQEDRPNTPPTSTTGGKELTSWERPWSLKELRQAKRWNLAADAGVSSTLLFDLFHYSYPLHFSVVQLPRAIQPKV